MIVHQSDKPKHSQSDIMLAKFMGYSYSANTFYRIEAGTGRKKWFKEAKYSYSWDALMEVYHKFRDLGFLKDSRTWFEHLQILAPLQRALIHGNFYQFYTEMVMAVAWYIALEQHQSP